MNIRLKSIWKKYRAFNDSLPADHSKMTAEQRKQMEALDVELDSAMGERPERLMAVALRQ